MCIVDTVKAIGQRQEAKGTEQALKGESIGLLPSPSRLCFRASSVTPAGMLSPGLEPSLDG